MLQERSNPHLGNGPSTVYYLISRIRIIIKLYYKSSIRIIIVAEAIGFCSQVDINSKRQLLLSQGS